MDLHQLEIFIQVASLKSFSRTAEHLFISQPTVSSRIKTLEQELGAPLLDRNHPEGIALTELGREFLDYAQEMLNVRDRAINRLNKTDKVFGHFHIGASTVPGCYILPQILSDYCLSNPEVKVDVTIRDTSQVLMGILSYDFDIGMVGNKEEGNQLNYTKVAEDELVLITATGLFSPEGYISGDVIPLSVCRHKVWLIRETGSATRSVLEKALLEKGEELKTFSRTMFIDSLEGIKHAVRWGMGVSVVSRRSVEDYINMGYLDYYIIRELDLKRAFYLVFHRHRVLSAAVINFLNNLS